MLNEMKREHPDVPRERIEALLDETIEDGYLTEHDDGTITVENVGAAVAYVLKRRASRLRDRHLGGNE